MCWFGVAHIQPEYYFMLRSNIQECVGPLIELLYHLLHFLLSYASVVILCTYQGLLLHCHLLWLFLRLFFDA